MKVAVEHVPAQIYVEGKLTTVAVTIEVDTDRLSDAARRAFHSKAGIASWSNGAIRAFIEEPNGNRE